MLHNKFRPKSFDDVIGNDVTKSALKALLSREKGRPHSFLLYGSKGTGKTTIARIIANSVACHDYDLTEMNFSNTRGIDTSRELIEVADYVPRYGKSRVWIFDEFHKCTNDAQNSLLKLLEEPPKHGYYILCTTDPQKIISTIRDRCYSFQTELLSEDRLLELIDRVLKAEGKELPEKIKEHVASKADGSARSCLVMLDKIIDVPESDLSDISNIIDEEESEIKQLCQYFLKKNKLQWKGIASILKKINREPETIRHAILAYMNVVLLNSENPQAALIIDCFKDPFYNSGKAGLTLACYEVLAGLE